MTQMVYLSKMSVRAIVVDIWDLDGMKHFSNGGNWNSSLQNIVFIPCSWLNEMI
jgi:hypothetical protein